MMIDFLAYWSHHLINNQLFYQGTSSSCTYFIIAFFIFNIISLLILHFDDCFETYSIISKWYLYFLLLTCSKAENNY